MTENVERRIRGILAEVLGKDAQAVAALPDDIALFDSELGLDSLTGARVIAVILDQFGVDIAADDLNLDSLETIATLRDFVTGNESVQQPIGNSPNEAGEVRAVRREPCF